MHLIAIGENPDGNLGMCKALKEPNETVKGDRFQLPRQSGTTGEMATIMWFSQADADADSWPVFPIQF